MKVIAVVNNYESEEPLPRQSRGWFLIADSALTNTGKPFYTPDHLGTVTVALSAAIRFDRLGKSISPKFASRYFSHVAPALHFRLPDYGRQLQEKGLPTDAALNFDKALFVGDFFPIDELKDLQLLLNGSEMARWKPGKLIEAPEGIISEISQLNTVKMGDLLLPGFAKDVQITRGDLLEVRGNQGVLFRVKVK